VKKLLGDATVERLQTVHRSTATMRNLAVLVVLLLVGMGLFALTPLGKVVLSSSLFLLMHSLMEIFAVSVMVMVFAIAWSNYREDQSRNLLLLGSAALAVALFDIGHLLSYRGMPEMFTDAGPDKAIAFWLLGRLTLAAGMLAMAALPWREIASRRTRGQMLAAALSLVALGYWLVLSHSDWLPVFFEPGRGLTEAKYLAELLVMALLLLATLLIWRDTVEGRSAYDARYLLAGILTSLVGEMCFVLYSNVTDAMNLLGHGYKLLAAFFLYRAVFIENVRVPLRHAQNNEAYFRKLMDAAPDGILVVNAGGEIVAVNEKVGAIFGYARDALVGRSVDMLVPLRAQGDHSAKLDGFFRHPTWREMGAHREIWGRLSDGSELPLEISLSPLMDAGDTMVMCVVRDISARKRAETKLRQQEEELRALTDNSPDIISRFDRQLRRIYVNNAISRVDGKPREFYLNKTFRELGKPDEFAQAWEVSLQQVFDSAEGCSFEFYYDSIAEGRKYYFARLMPEFSLAGEVEFVVAVASEITDRVRAEENSARLASILEAAPALVSISDPDFKLSYLNAAGRRMLDLDEDAPLPDWSGMFPAWALRHWQEDAIPEARSKGAWRGETAILRQDGSELPVMHTLIAHRDASGKVRYWSDIAQDFSEFKRLEQQLSHQATHDALTGLPNRLLLLDRLQQSMEYAMRDRSKVAVLYLDLDNFKNVNDTLGHFHGDELLRQVADRLRSVLRQVDTVGRLGGDEFAVLLDEIGVEEDALQIAAKVLGVFAAPFVLQQHEFVVGTSIGVALYSGDTQTPEDLLRNADIAMYEAKKRGRGNYCLYSPAMNLQLYERMQLHESLRRAVHDEEFVLYYQPKVDLATGEVCGMEALVRWIHPEKGMIPPDRFIPAAEESGLIIPLGQWVLREAMQQNKRWQAAGLPPLRVAVNLSARQFGDESLVEFIARTLTESGLDPKYLELEITESMLMENPEQALLLLHEMKALGITLSIDDFGTGYSSLAYLRLFPVDFVKIDRSFVIDAPTDDNDAAIASAIISMTHQLGIRVVAEGVETAQHVEFLQRQRCDEMQGYYFSRPVPAGVFGELIASGKRLSGLE
jgi:diguanylate cyclase (GGDEF)-like protein/PAS domain S-box-containing protein